MSEILKTLLSTIGIPAISLIGMWLLLRTYFEKRIASRFSILEQKLATRRGLERDVASRFRDAEMPAYPRVSELVYRAKDELKALLSCSTRLEASGSQLPRVGGDLMTTLYVDAFYMEASAFEAAHEVKRLVQDVLLTLEVETRPGLGERLQEPLPRAVRDQFVAAASAAKALCKEYRALAQQATRLRAGDLLGDDDS